MHKSLYLLIPLLAPLAVCAQDLAAHQTPAQAAASFSPPAASSPVNAPADASGATVDSWLNLQVGGTESAHDTPPLSGAIASKIYERYANSFTHAIPEHFERESFGVGSGSGGGGS